MKKNYLLITIVVMVLLILLIVMVFIKSATIESITLEKDLKFFPQFFLDDNNSFNSVIIVDELADEEDFKSADELLLFFSGIDKDPGNIPVESIKKYPKYSNLGLQNAMLIGSCNQEPHNRFVNIYVDCLSMKPEQALIRIVDHNDVWLLFVIGYTPTQTHNAIEVLTNYKEYDLKGQDVEVIKINNTFKIGEPT